MAGCTKPPPPVPRKPRVAVKTKTQLTDDSIMGTNNSSIVSKRSVERLYFPDESHFFRYFVKKPQRRAPLINRGYWLRMKAIDHIVHLFLKETSAKKRVVVNLGCGYDPLPWQCLARYPAASKEALFVDIDYKDLMLKKRSSVQATSQLSSFLTNVEVGEGEIILRSDQYVQMGCDLRDLKLLEKTLKSLVNVEESSIIFVAEVSITYMDKASADALIKWAATLPDATFCLLEQLLPAGLEHPFAQTMLAHFNKLGTPLHSVQSYPTVHHQEDRFRSQGWSQARGRNLWELWSASDFLNNEERRALDFIEPFDEWEEFALFGCHYVLLVASTQADSNLAAGSSASTDTAKLQQSRKGSLKPSYTGYPVGKGCNRFAASIPIRSSSPGTDIFGLFGGMGATTRTNAVDIYTHQGVTPFPHNTDTSIITPSARMCHTTTDLGDSGVLLVGGRTSPDNSLADCWLYHKWLNVWERLADLPSPRYRHQSVHIGQGHVLITQGRANSQKIADDYLIWHRTTGWRSCAVSGVKPASSYGNIVYTVSAKGATGIITGGVTDAGVIQNSIWQWQVDKLENATPIITFKLLERPESRSMLARFGASVATSGDRTYVVGGITGDGLIDYSNEVCSVHHDNFEILPIALDFTDNVRPLLVGTTAIANPTELVIMGGSAVCFSFGTFWNKGSYTLSTQLPGSSDDEKAHSKQIIETWSYFSTTVAAQYGTTNKHSNQAYVSRNIEPITNQVRRQKVESGDEFRKLVQAGVPVILSELDIGPCTTAWTAEYLKDQVGQREVVVHESTTQSMNFVEKNFAYKTKPFGEFIDQVVAGNRLYLRSLSSEKPSESPANISIDFPTLASDFRLPPELEFVAENMHSSPLRISGGVSMWLHYDVMANVLCQVKGNKRLLLFPPDDVKYFRFEPGSSSSSVDVFSNLVQFQDSHPYEVILKPGDILYLPALWLHAASPLDGMSISVNVFFRNLQNGYSAGRDVYGNRDLQAYEKGRQDIQKIVKSFDSLPVDVRSFYLKRLADEFASTAG